MPPRLTNVLCHPRRAQILESLEEGAATPAQLAERVDQGIGQVAYHVAILTEAGCVRAVGGAEKKRKTVERAYEALPPAKWARAQSSAARLRRRGSGRRRPPRQG
jgi:DNA-binding transcriptional ArsR family regulator